jgi:hypothetical protein
MTVSPFSHSLFLASCAWIHRECTSADLLAEAVGISPAELLELGSAGVIPAATYSIYESGIISPITSIGDDDRLVESYYGPAIVTWLRRAAVHRRIFGRQQLSRSLEDWWHRDFRAALISQAGDASRFGWTHLFEDGQLNSSLCDRAAADLWREWMGGGWAVCLRRFSGYDVVTKDLELNRIPILADEREGDPTADLRLIDAMLRYDAVVRPFAPFERPISSRRRVTDSIAQRFGLPWPEHCNDADIMSGLADVTSSAPRQEAEVDRLQIERDGLAARAPIGKRVQERSGKRAVGLL